MLGCHLTGTYVCCKAIHRDAQNRIALVFIAEMEDELGELCWKKKKKRKKGTEKKPPQHPQPKQIHHQSAVQFHVGLSFYELNIRVPDEHFPNLIQFGRHL